MRLWLRAAAGMWPLWAVNAAAIGFVATYAIAGCSSTPTAKSPALEQSVAVVTVGARVVHGADVACAAAGKRLRELGDPAKAATLTGKCVDALRPAADALDMVATALDAGKAVSDQQIACAVALGLDAIVRVRPVLADVGVTMPATVESYAKLAAPWLPVAEGMVCKS